MILCDFCDDRASFSFRPIGLPWGAATVCLCHWHLTLYYLGIAQSWHD